MGEKNVNRRYDEKKNLIFYQYEWLGKKFITTYEYDERGNMTYEKGRKEWKRYEYDSKNNVIYWETKWRSKKLNIFQHIRRVLIKSLIQ
jgi:uncharacterized protein RhaS with RHS repeats